MLFIGGTTERLLLGAEMMEMMKLYKDGNQREFTMRDMANFRGGGSTVSELFSACFMSPLKLYKCS